SFRAFCDAVGVRSITEFNYRYSDPTRAHVFVGLRLERGAEERRELVASLTAAGYELLDMTDNEVANLHVRYMVGGRAGHRADERLFPVEVPERPGALRRFVQAMEHSWNISLSHYRNHGADFGRVLVGLEGPPADTPLLHRFLADVGYPSREETDNPAYQLFL